MSTLSVTTINTANTTTDLTLKTGNTTGGSILIPSSGSPGIVLQSNSTTNAVTIDSSGNMKLLNNKNFSFTTTNGNTVNLVQQNDDNLVLYSTTTSGAQRAIWSVYANNNTAAFSVATNLTAATNTFTLGTSSIAANGYTRLPNGLLYQWCSGTVTVGSGVSNVVSFPTTFTTFYSASLVGNSTATGSAGQAGPLVLFAANTSTLTIRSVSGAVTSAASAFYITAIGV